MAMIEVSNLTKYYGDLKAVDGISFTVEKGQIVGFVGKNGAGKSTTIRTMLHLIGATEGTCRICELDSATEHKQIMEFVGYMPSDAMFYANITCKELFQLAITFSGVAFEEVETLAAYFELNINKKIAELSLGNRKKVSIIQALLKKCKVLILDEPTSGLDPVMQEKFFALLQEKKEEGVTIFLSSHNLVEIERYCDRALIIKDGKLVDDIDLKNTAREKTYIVHYQCKDGQTRQFEHTGDINAVVQKLATMSLQNLEIRYKSVEEEFIKYYQEDAQ